MGSEALSIVMRYCEPVFANYHSASAVDSISLRGKADFGDIVYISIIVGGSYVRSVMYSVKDVDDIVMPVLLQLEQSDIPLEITKDLCDPIEFYRFSNPMHAMQRVRYLNFSFSHRCIQRILQIHAKNKKDFDYEDDERWDILFARKYLHFTLEIDEEFDGNSAETGLQRHQLFEKHARFVVGKRPNVV